MTGVKPVAAKQLRPMVRGAVRDGLLARGWTPQRGRATVFDAPAGAVEPPLRFELDVESEPAKYGGIDLSAVGSLRYDEAAALVAAMPEESLPRTPAATARERAPYFALVGVTSGLLAKWAGAEGPMYRLGRWTIEQEEQVAPAVDELLRLVDGPLADWLHDRRTIDEVLDGPTAESANLASGLRARAVAAAALLAGRADVARRAVAEGPEEDGRLALFERLLAERFPAYGPLQRS